MHTLPNQSCLVIHVLKRLASKEYKAEVFVLDS